MPVTNAGATAARASHRRVTPHAHKHKASFSPRRILGVCAGKATRAGVRRLGRGNGTTMPGKVALALSPRLLAELAAEIPAGSVLVTGTNGKGTTCRMLTEVMRAAGLEPVLNREGSNQPTGLATTLLARSSLLGHLTGDARAVCVFEVDEGSLPDILPLVPAGAVVFTNLFRDQMDRYLELDYITSRWERAMRELPASTVLVLNADDPRLAYLAEGLPNPRLHYGLGDLAHARRDADRSSDFPRCPRCRGELRYSCVFFAHLGHWKCMGCGLARPEPQVEARKVDLLGPVSSRVHLGTAGPEAILELPVPGLYNAYNAVAAAAAAAACALRDSALPAIGKITTGTFRMERVSVEGRDVYLALAKNPNGYTEVLRSLLGDGEPKRMLLALNDRPGNQQPDISWIWDVDFESLRGLVPEAVLSGNRCHDLAVRLKYAGWLGDGGTAGTAIALEPDPVAALRRALSATPAGGSLWVVSTYLVLWQLRDWLHRQGYVGPLWNR
jgi:UDP-N-acetylmuramyl tripeptide synthase